MNTLYILQLGPGSPPTPDPIFLSGFLMDFWRLAGLFPIIWSAPLWGYQLKYQRLMASHSLDVSAGGVCSQYVHRLAVRGWQMSGIPELKGSALYLKLLTVWYIKQSAPFISAKYCYRKHNSSSFVLQVVLGVSSLNSEVRRWRLKVTETLYSVKTILKQMLNAVLYILYPCWFVCHITDLWTLYWEGQKQPQTPSF